MTTERKLPRIKVDVQNDKIVLIGEDLYRWAHNAIYKLKGGYRKKGKEYAPLTKGNVDVILTELPMTKKIKENTFYAVTYTFNFAFHAQKEIRENEIRTNRLNHLRKINFDNVDARLVKINHKGPVPFKNQKLGLEWESNMKQHALLWEMGPLLGSTKIITDNGIINLKDYKDELVANPEGLQKSNFLIKKKSTKLIKLQTYHGPSITGSPEHEIETTNGSKTFSEVTIGDELLIGMPGVFPEKSLVSNDYAVALGMMVAEGTCKNPQIEFIFEGNEDLIENIRTELKPAGETTRIKGGKKVWRAWWYVQVVRKMKGNIFPEKYSENDRKIVPEKILKSNMKTQIQFLYGYFRGDGTITKRNGMLVNFKLTERDENLVNQVQLMLFNMGIITKKYKYDNYNCFNLTASNDETIRMINLGLIKTYRSFKTTGNNGKKHKFLNNHLISKVVSVNEFEKETDIYCLNMNNEKHLFYGNGIVVHNTGKTRTAIEGFIYRKNKKEVSKALIICPLSLVNNWVEEFETWSDLMAIGIKGTPEEKRDILQRNYDAYVITYESVLGLKNELLELINDRWMLIADETTKIKNPSAKRTKALFELGELTEYKTILNGTPITQNAGDLYSQFKFLNNGRSFGLNHEAFIDTHFWREGYRTIIRHGHAELITEKVYNWSTRFLKQDCVDIPEKMYEKVTVDLPDYNREVYNQMLQFAVTQIANAAQNGVVTAPVILTQLLRLSQITSGFAKDEDGRIIDFKENPKMDALREILENACTNGNQIIVWSRFKHDIDNICKLCDELEILNGKLYSDTKADDRTKIIKDFQTNKIKLIAGTPGTGGLGINLTNANIAIYYSNDYSLGNRLQSEDRIHRAGQKNKVTYIDILAKETIDISIRRILKDKKSIANLITKDNIISFASGIF